jgi:flavodoxin
MNIKITYLSKTGHSKKIAQAIGKEFGIEPLDIADNPTIFGADLLIIVGGVYYGDCDPAMAEFGGKIKPVNAQKVVLITSCSSKKDTMSKLIATLKSNYIEILGDYIVPGAFLLVNFGHPNKDDVENAVAYTRRTVDRIEGKTEDLT